ncbi:Copia protein, partial [Mucuna pruriens]
MYLTSTRFDILFLVSLLSRFMHCASELHLKATKSVVRYIKGTINYEVKYCKVLFQYGFKCILLVFKEARANLGLKQDQSTKFFVHNQAVISISFNPMFHGKTKNFNMKLFYLKEVQENSDVSLIYCKTEDEVANMFTKSFSLSRFEFLREKLGVCSLQGKEEN